MEDFSTFHFPYTVEEDFFLEYSLQYAAFQNPVECPWTLFPVFFHGISTGVSTGIPPDKLWHIGQKESWLQLAFMGLA